VNTAQKRLLLRKVTQHFGENLNGRCLAVWGLSFKPRTDDMREAPSVTLIEGLLGAGARVQAHDPVAKEVAQRIFADRITYFDNSYEAVRGADAVLSSLGAPSLERPGTILADGMRTITSAMRRLGVRRIIAVAGAGVLDAPAGGLVHDQAGFPAAFRAISEQHAGTWAALRPIRSPRWARKDCERWG
jgi:hypothetical protein